MAPNFTMEKPRLLRGIPSNSIFIITLLIGVNLCVWATAGIVLHLHPRLASPAVLAYTLGLRHALDADHVSAIDLITRRLLASGQRPASVGCFFSLGHSSVVVATCVVVAATSGALRTRFGGLSRVGNVVGGVVSAGVLVVLCAANAWVLRRLVARVRRVRRGEADVDEGSGSGRLACVGQVLDVLFRAIDRPWKMYPLGVVFGLGFDTASEIALLGIASIQAIKGTSIWLILVFPILFTSGMCLLDTLDGALMLALYTSPTFARDPLAILYYSIILTAITIAVSAFIAAVQVLTLIQNLAHPHGPLWDAVAAIADNFDLIGACICALFLLVGITAACVYRPWRDRFPLDDDDEAAAAARPLLAAARPPQPSSSPSSASSSPPRHQLANPSLLDSAPPQATGPDAA